MLVCLKITWIILRLLYVLLMFFSHYIKMESSSLEEKNKIKYIWNRFRQKGTKLHCN